MSVPNRASTLSVRGVPLQAMLVPVPLVCFVATLVTDCIYWRTSQMLWADMSAWLLALGLLFAVPAAVAGLIDLLGDSRFRTVRAAWIYTIGNLVVPVLAGINMLVHSRDAYTSVIPAGLGLSTVVAVIVVLTSWYGWRMVYRHGAGVSVAALR